MSIFENANRKVEKHNYGMNSKFDRFGRRIIDLPEKQEPVTEDITAKIIQGPDTVKPKLSEGEKTYRATKVQNAINYNIKSNIMRNMHSEILNGVLENVISSIYYDALYLDDDFKEYNSAAITESVHEFLSERGGYKYISEAYNKTKSPLLKSIMDICEETAREISDRKVKECNEKEKNKESLDDIIIFDMNDEEKEKLDYDKDSIGLDKISTTIKDKILNVVKEEKKREAEHVELMEEIENQLTEDENVNDEKAVAEALSSIFVKSTNIEEGTLFNSMLRKNYKNVIESGYDSLTLSKLNRQSEIEEELNKVSFEDIVTENELINPKGQLITREVKDIFNDFMDVLERQKDFGNSDTEALIEAFACCENKFYEVANSKISKTELKAIKRDLEILQETFNDFLLVEEGAIKDGAKKIGDTLYKVDAKLAGAGYAMGIKLIKDPKKLRKMVEIDKKTIKLCKAELAKRDKADESKIKKYIKDIGKSYYYSLFKATIDNKIYDGDKEAAKKVPTAHLKQLLRYSDEYIRVAEKRIAQLEAKQANNKKSKKAVKEAFDNFDYNAWMNSDTDEDFITMFKNTFYNEPVEESFEDFEYGLWLNEDEDSDIIEEAKVLNAIHGAVDKVDSKIINTLYKAVIKASKDPKRLREQIKADKVTIQTCKAELKRREKIDDNVIKKVFKHIGGTFYFGYGGGVIVNLLQQGEKEAAKPMNAATLKKLIKYGEIYISLAEKRIKELEKGGKKSVKENYDFDQHDYELIYDAVEECGVVFDEGTLEYVTETALSETKEKRLQADVEKFKKNAESAMEGKSLKELKKALEENDKAYEKIKAEVNRREKLDENKAKKILDTIKRTLTIFTIGIFIPATNHKYNTQLVLEQFARFNRTFDKMLRKRIKELEKGGKKSVKENYDYFGIEDDFDTVEEKNVITNNKFVDSIKDKFTPPGGSNKKKNKKDGKTKATKEGVDCDNAGGCASSTKEGANCGENCDKKVKKIDTTFDMDAKVKEGSFEYFDLDDELDIAEEAVNKAGLAVTGRNLGTLLSNMIKRKKDINSVHDGLLKIANSCKTVAEVEYLQKDISGGKKLMQTKASKAKTAEERKMYQTHANWLGSEYSKALSAKKKELKAKESTKNKTVKEACSDILFECMNIIDKKLDLHEASDLNMANEVRVNYNGRTTLIPIINKRDAQLEGLDLPYKMKHVIESLTNILIGNGNDDRTYVVKKALRTNKENTKAILESFKTIPSTPAYKVNYFNTFNDLLDILTEDVEKIQEMHDIIEINEYDDSSLDIYEEDYSYNVLTESFNDFDVNGEDEIIDMDFILADTITKYTLLETMYTLQLENPKYNDIKSMTNKLLNR